MSGTVTIRSSNATKAALGAWRQRGYEAGNAGRAARPPIYDAAASAYMQGYRRGKK